MSALPGVSVVIPNYNYQRFVADAIESALRQDHPEVEVIVVDDCSTDGSREVIERYVDRVRTIFLPENGDQTAACNAGWSASRHEIVIFLDSDDMLASAAASTVARAWTPSTAKVQFCLASIDAAACRLGTSRPSTRVGSIPPRSGRNSCGLGRRPRPRAAAMLTPTGSSTASLRMKLSSRRPAGFSGWTRSLRSMPRSTARC